MNIPKAAMLRVTDAILRYFFIFSFIDVLVGDFSLAGEIGSLAMAHSNVIKDTTRTCRKLRIS